MRRCPKMQPARAKPTRRGRSPTSQWKTASTALSEERGRNSVLERYTPITRTGRKKLHSKLERLRAESKETPPSAEAGDATSIYPDLRKQGLEDEIAAELAMPLLEKPCCRTMKRPVRRMRWPRRSRPKHGSHRVATLRQKGRRIIVLVGPNGSGKTATAAKMAAACPSG